MLRCRPTSYLSSCSGALPSLPRSGLQAAKGPLGRESFKYTDEIYYCSCVCVAGRLTCLPRAKFIILHFLAGIFTVFALPGTMFYGDVTYLHHVAFFLPSAVTWGAMFGGLIGAGFSLHDAINPFLKAQGFLTTWETAMVMWVVTAGQIGALTFFSGGWGVIHRSWDCLDVVNSTLVIQTPPTLSPSIPSSLSPMDSS